ncbi:MAG: elongation factor 1-beta [Fervidicoccaceae archaeon]|jgi:elongation factor 1-beta
MARVLASVKVYPSDSEADRGKLLDEIRKVLPEEYHILRAAEEPIAFGYVALKLYITFPEETEGGTDKLEEMLRSVNGVDDLEIESVSRLSSF